MDSKCDYDNPHLRLVFFRASRHLFKTGQNGGTHSNSCTLEDAFESEKDFQTANLLKPVYSWYSFEKSLNSFKPCLSQPGSHLFISAENTLRGDIM